MSSRDAHLLPIPPGVLSFLWQPSHTRTSCSIPRCSSFLFFELQAPQNTPPQFLQWCFLFVTVKGVLHRWHRSESTHSGADRDEIIELVRAFETGGKVRE